MARLLQMGVLQAACGALSEKDAPAWSVGLAVVALALLVGLNVLLYFAIRG